MNRGLNRGIAVQKPTYPGASNTNFAGDMTTGVDGTINYTASGGVGGYPYVTSLPAAANPVGGLSSSLPTLFAAGIASQAWQTFADAMIYIQWTTAGSATSIRIGPTLGTNSLLPAFVIYSSSTATLGQVTTIRLPAGWYLYWTGTTTASTVQWGIIC